MTFEQWTEGVPLEIRQDTLWRLEAYRLALFLADLAWPDGTKLQTKRATIEHGDQILRATAKIGASISEGYSRGTGKDRARFFEYALGSARESRDWYYAARRVLGEAVTTHRLSLTTQLIKLLIVMIANERRSNRRLDGESK